MLAGPLARKLVVGGRQPLRHFERIDVGAAAHQSHVLLGGALQPGLLVEMLPRSHRLRIALGLGEEPADISHVVGSRAGIGESLVEGIRRLLAGEHRLTLLLRNADARLLEARSEHMLGDEHLPRRSGQRSGLLLVALLGAALGLDLLVEVVVLRIVDLLAVDHAHFRVVAREAHFGLQREDERQEGQCDDDRKHDAELGA